MLFVSLFLTLSPSSHASEQEQSYSSKVGNKALNGITNISTAVLEFPKSIINTTNDSNIFYGFSGGLIKGMINTAGRIGTGVLDLITAPIPTKPIAQPVRVFDDFDQDTTYEGAFRLQEK